jgi:hypothetical protein
VDPSGGELLGNFPQAFSHIGLVNAAWAISQAKEKAGTRHGNHGAGRAATSAAEGAKA